MTKAAHVLRVRQDHDALIGLLLREEIVVGQKTKFDAGSGVICAQTGEEATTVEEDLGSKSNYQRLLRRVHETGAYCIPFYDGSMVNFHYQFNNEGLVNQSFAFYECPEKEDISFRVRGVDYNHDPEIYGGYPCTYLRFDYSPDQFEVGHHPKTHLHLGTVADCRIPSSGPISFYQFMIFVLRNFYNEKWRLLAPKLQTQIVPYLKEDQYDHSIETTERDIAFINFHS